MVTLKTVKVIHDFQELGFSDASGVTLGQQIDRHIKQMSHAGELIQEISVFFEDIKEQEQLMDTYRSISIDFPE